ncbi:manganese efflux pump [Edaphobacillus lindanitolerans]|uniref:Putative Mn2+ efflux pump MntP n=1 Tax=Edaphobacillus lindanitolerans TaxID=550447 RepID=A0A1U7PME8_9BACI|nr:manganese efflux pump [Edaphobacillus lindanitolerans]SIT69613.1 Putative Mn2+ efflux pump MntP [Edaphobacillus lindanitolerans]
MWQEPVAGVLTAVDAAAVYAILPLRRNRLPLAMWTGTLHMIFPLAGFLAGGAAAALLAGLGVYISAILLILLGLHMILSDDGADVKMPPYMLAALLSVDSFSVSMSFGMLQLDMIRFIVSAGASAFILSCGALYMRGTFNKIGGRRLRLLAGAGLVLMGVLPLL